jgi:hypothetical protein
VTVYVSILIHDNIYIYIFIITNDHNNQLFDRQATLEDFKISKETTTTAESKSTIST